VSRGASHVVVKDLKENGESDSSVEGEEGLPAFVVRLKDGVEVLDQIFIRAKLILGLVLGV